MKTKCVVSMLALSFVGIPVVQAQQATNSSPTPKRNTRATAPVGVKERTRSVSRQVSAGGGRACAGIR